MVAGPYIHFPVDGGPAVYRERVYTYELYHQLRCAWPPRCEYTVNGEVHKGRHPILTPMGFRAVMPDLLVHRPGDGGMAFNYAVIEVKPADVDDDGIDGDVVKLDEFKRIAGYERAIYLIYGAGQRDDFWLDKINARKAALRIVSDIELWLHREAGAAASLAVARR